MEYVTTLNGKVYYKLSIDLTEIGKYIFESNLSSCFFFIID